ncbi:hypothetical protein WEU38_03920 [Cyanobacterium aponinum AL20118]|uniref:Uncharacterized protein n=1 Tax=Cyanobacterium aponinum AL20115 TaxID=3090662 RepID=A0AAF0ZJJ0_9CHRO|nr:hypothetical protein [Cyanobacterium aponinum]WPF89432.1 hypothetical protein SAY89_03935 [Cyanobacterium aponinum AL20115]
MKQKINKRYIYQQIFITLSLSIIPLNSVCAEPVIYDFTVNVTEGSLKDNTYDGFIIYDDETVTGAEEEMITVEDGLKVCMNFFNENYDETKDSDYPQYPQLILKNGKPESLDFWLEPNPRRQWWNKNGWLVTVTQRPENSNLPVNCPNGVTP